MQVISQFREAHINVDCIATKTFITSESPAPEATMSLQVSGMNFTQKMFAECPESMLCINFLLE